MEWKSASRLFQSPIDCCPFSGVWLYLSIQGPFLLLPSLLIPAIFLYCPWFLLLWTWPRHRLQISAHPSFPSCFLPFGLYSNPAIGTLAGKTIPSLHCLRGAGIWLHSLRRDYLPWFSLQIFCLFCLLQCFRIWSSPSGTRLYLHQSQMQCFWIQIHLHHGNGKSTVFHHRPWIFCSFRYHL